MTGIFYCYIWHFPILNKMFLWLVNLRNCNYIQNNSSSRDCEVENVASMEEKILSSHDCDVKNVASLREVENVASMIEQNRSSNPWSSRLVSRLVACRPLRSRAYARWTTPCPPKERWGGARRLRLAERFAGVRDCGVAVCIVWGAGEKKIMLTTIVLPDLAV